MEEDIILEETRTMEGLSVLIIEDDGLSLEETTAALESVGAEVFSVPDPAGAAELLLYEQINVIIGALDLVDEQCIEVVRNYKQRMPDMLFLRAYRRTV